MQTITQRVVQCEVHPTSEPRSIDNSATASDRRTIYSDPSLRFRPHQLHLSTSFETSLRLLLRHSTLSALFRNDIKLPSPSGMTLNYQTRSKRTGLHFYTIVATDLCAGRPHTSITYLVRHGLRTILPSPATRRHSTTISGRPCPPSPRFSLLGIDSNG